MSTEEETPFPSAREDKERAAPLGTSQTRSPSYKLAFADTDFLVREDLRPVRLQLELLKPELLLREQGVRSTIAVFGSARIPDPEVAQQRLNAAEAAAHANPRNAGLAKVLGRARRTLANSRYYSEAQRLAEIVSETCVIGSDVCDFVVLTGGRAGDHGGRQPRCQ